MKVFPNVLELGAKFLHKTEGEFYQMCVLISIFVLCSNKKNFEFYLC